MQDARYFRAQAQLFLEMARQMSDRKAAEGLQEKAADYHRRATDLEAGQPDDDSAGLQCPKPAR